MSETFRVRTLDWSPEDAGFVILSNYWMRFWRPLLGIRAASLYEQLLCYTHGDSSEATPSLTTVADALGCDRRTLYGWVHPASGERKPGLIHTLIDAGLLDADRDPERLPVWLFSIRKRPPLLTPAQVTRLRHPLQRQHAEWMQRNAPQPNTRSMVTTTPSNIRSVVTTTPPVVTTTPPVVTTTRTIPSNNTQQQRERDPKAKQVWLAMLSDLDHDALPPALATSLPSLIPLSITRDALTLEAPTTSTAHRWLGSTAACDLLRRACPLPVTSVTILAPEV